MIRPLFLLYPLFIFCTATAHPGIGIVKDSKGFIYYTDLVNVYRIDPATEKKTIVVRGLHTHELYIDKNDNLFGEHLWFVDNGINQFDHFQWRLNTKGKLDTIYGPSQAYIANDYSLCRDAKGNEYRVQALQMDRILKKKPTGESITIAEGDYKDVIWLQATADGNVYFTQKNNLYRINQQDAVSLVASAIANDPGLYGIWTDNAVNIYVALLADRMIKKITPAGKMENILFKQEGNWGPVGGLFDDSGNLWVLEWSAKNEARVRKISKETRLMVAPESKWPSRIKTYWPEWLIISVLFIGFSIFMIRRTRK